MPGPQMDIGYWLGQKYALLGKQAEGQYQKDIAEAGLAGAQTGQVAPNAASLRALQAAQAGYYGAEAGKTGQEAQQVAPDAAARRALLGAQTGLVGAQTSEMTGFYNPEQANYIKTLLRSRTPLWNWGQQSPTFGQRRPATNPLLDLYQPPSLKPFRKGTANVKASKGGGGGKGGKAGGQPEGLEAMLPALLAAMQGQGGAPGGSPTGAPPAPGMRKGSANVKPSGKGGKGGKTSGAPKAGGGGGGLEAILPALLAASQAGQMGGGAMGPQAPDGSPPSMAPGAAAMPGYQGGTSDVFGDDDPYMRYMRRLQAITGGLNTSRPIQMPGRLGLIPDQAPGFRGLYSTGSTGNLRIPQTPPPLAPTQLVPSEAGPGFSTGRSGHLVIPPIGSTVLPYPGMTDEERQTVLRSGYVFPQAATSVAQSASQLEPVNEQGLIDRGGGAFAMRQGAPATYQQQANNMLALTPIAQAEAQRASPEGYQISRWSPDLKQHWYERSAGPPVMDPGTGKWVASPAPPGFARGAPNVPRGQSAPGYPFGAGYLFGATAVPGQGSGTVDKVPAMLAPHEAVLNRAAADMLGRGAIAQLNAAGVRKMGLR